MYDFPCFPSTYHVCTFQFIYSTQNNKLYETTLRMGGIMALTSTLVISSIVNIVLLRRTILTNQKCKLIWSFYSLNELVNLLVIRLTLILFALFAYGSSHITQLPIELRLCIQMIYSFVHLCLFAIELRRYHLALSPGTNLAFALNYIAQIWAMYQILATIFEYYAENQHILYRLMEKNNIHNIHNNTILYSNYYYYWLNGKPI